MYHIFFFFITTLSLSLKILYWLLFFHQNSKDCSPFVSPWIFLIKSKQFNHSILSLFILLEFENYKCVDDSEHYFLTHTLSSKYLPDITMQISQDQKFDLSHYFDILAATYSRTFAIPS